MDIHEVLAKMTLEEKASLCSGSDFWHTKALPHLGVPQVMMCDGPHGLRKQKGEADHLGINESIETVCYPTASALASSFDRDLLAQLGELLGQECQAEDVGMLLGPGLNIKRSPLCGRNFEYFSEDPYLAGQLGAAYIRGLQSCGVAACPKHFAVNNQETARMSISAEIGERALHEIYLPAFEAAVKDGSTESIMCAYNAINGTYCAENKLLLTDILREKWGFDGFVVTDWGAVKDRIKGLKAGLDLEMPGNGGILDKAIVAAVQNGTLEESVLDEVVARMLTFVKHSCANKRPDATIDREVCSRRSGDIAAQCAVLLKNNGALPLQEASPAVFIGAFADRPRYQGAGSSHINVAKSVSALEAAADNPVTYVQGYCAQQVETDDTMLTEAVEAAKHAPVAVIFAGLPAAFETEGCDRETMKLPANQNELVTAVAAVQPNTVVVLHGGAPVELPWLDQVNAVLCMYLGGSNVGDATVRLLYGQENPNGKLAETWPKRLEDTPAFLNFPGEENSVEYHEDIFVGYRYYDKKQLDVNFPFGHGLSYTTFGYSDLQIEAGRITDQDLLTVSCQIENMGAVPGKEAVQLYVRDVHSSVRRPIRELKEFTKVALAPGERTTVAFTLSKRAFAYYEPRIHDWFVESGEFAIEIGASSRDIRLSGSVYVEGTQEIPIVYTRFSPVRDLAKTAKGRSLLAQMMPRRSDADLETQREENRKNMGEGSDKMMEEMARSMPLMSIVTFGQMTMEQLDGLLAMLNN